MPSHPDRVTPPARPMRPRVPRVQPVRPPRKPNYGSMVSGARKAGLPKPVKPAMMPRTQPMSPPKAPKPAKGKERR